MLVNRFALLFALEELSRTTGSARRSIRSYVLFEAAGGRACLTATNGHTWVTIGVPSGEGEMAAAFPLRPALAFVAIPDPEFSAADSDLVELLHPEPSQIVIAREGRFITQPAVPASAFPRPRTHRLLRKDSHAAQANEHQPGLHPGNPHGPRPGSPPG